MRVKLPVLLSLLASVWAFGQAALQPQGTAPTAEEVRKGMGIASQGDLRGQQDAIGFASKADQMARVWDLAAAPPPPESLGAVPPAGVAGVICPHDDYLFAGRVYRKLLPLVTAKTVVMVGVFHKYRRFGAHDVLVFDSYRAWRTPDGEARVSPLREELLGRLRAGDAVQDNTAHDSEHSLEALLFWLKHARPDIDFVPVIVPAMGFDRMRTLAAAFGAALGQKIQEHGWQLGRDVAIVISSDAVHYGDDFKYAPFGAGGVEAYVKACDQDGRLLTGPLAGPITTGKVEQFFGTCVNPEQPSEYRLTWCGRFSIPFGMLVLERVTGFLGLPTPVGHPVAYGTSIGAPELPVKELGMGATAPANLYHFVGYPAVAFSIGE
ncbi:MAG: AmmeMemoRadiSam system protein B [Acidobacteriia bacterium]|nr:AmmeMemoRadiSam system protein B [Terriglobia bacterium]